MNELLQRAIDAQGGMENWRKYNSVSAHTHTGGILWEMKGHGGEIEEVDVVVNLLEQKTSHIPTPQWHTAYGPDRTAIESGGGETIEEIYNPRSSFKDHTWETKWSNLQLSYFSGYATWNYFNTPFQFTRHGFESKEIEPWIEDGETWRRLVVTWPKDIHTHSTEQVLYFSPDGLIKRVDYRVEIAGNRLCAHYLSGYQESGGITMATKRIVYQIGEDNKPMLDKPVIVSIDWSNIKYE